MMKTRFKATIVLPSSYAKSKTRYPVIYLLHGFGGDHTSWPRITPLKEHADSHNVLLVCPYGDDSWYMDSPVRITSLFETYIIREVVGFIDAHYRTWPHGEGRAVMGVSMGGHGAIYLITKHPETFTGACSIAGIMDLTEFPNVWKLSLLLGRFSDNATLWESHSCTGIINRLKGLSKTVILDCGKDDFALKGNSIADSLMENDGIPRYFYSRDGTHDWDYARAAAPDHIRFLRSKLTPPK